MAILGNEHTIVEASYTRLANTTQYTANDALSDDTASATYLTFNRCARLPGMGGRVLSVSAIGTANQATKPALELYLFDDSVTATADNAEFGLTDADAAKCIGAYSFANTDFIDLDVTSGANGNMYGTPSTVPVRVFRCQNTSQALYGLVKVTNTYTPVSGEKITFQLHLEQD